MEQSAEDDKEEGELSDDDEIEGGSVKQDTKTKLSHERDMCDDESHKNRFTENRVSNDRYRFRSSQFHSNNFPGHHPIHKSYAPQNSRPLQYDRIQVNPHYTRESLMERERRDSRHYPDRFRRYNLQQHRGSQHAMDESLNFISKTPSTSNFWEKTNLKNTKSSKETKNTLPDEDALEYRNALRVVEEKIQQLEKAKPKSKTTLGLNSESQSNSCVPELESNIQSNISTSNGTEDNAEKSTLNAETRLSNEKEEDGSSENTSIDSDIIIIEPPPPEVIVLDDDLHEDSQDHREKMEKSGISETDKMEITKSCQQKKPQDDLCEKTEKHDPDNSGSVNEDQNDSNEQNMELDDSVGGNDEEEEEGEVEDGEDLDEEELDELELRKMALQSSLSLTEKSSSPSNSMERTLLPASGSVKGPLRSRKLAKPPKRRSESMKNQ